ncbi:MAG TPA: hypothetical protein VF627_05260 [Abditibacterium sp.]
MMPYQKRAGIAPKLRVLTLTFALTLAAMARNGSMLHEPLEGSIAYSSRLPGSLKTSICVANADGSGERRLPGTERAQFLHMNRAGSFLLFVQDEEEWTAREIFIIGTDGKGKKKLTNNRFDDNQPRFSSDGRSIVFVSERDGSPEIYTMNSDGSQQKRMTFGRGVNSGPCFSPDGKRIVFATFVPKQGYRGTYSLNFINSDGTGLRTFLKSTSYIDPIWHPNGESLLCHNDKDFVVFSLTGGKTRHIPVKGSWPSWSPNGHHIVFIRLTELIKNNDTIVPYYNVFTISAHGQETRAVVNQRRSDDSLSSSQWATWGGKVSPGR